MSFTNNWGEAFRKGVWNFILKKKFKTLHDVLEFVKPVEIFEHKITISDYNGWWYVNINKIIFYEGAVYVRGFRII